MAQLQAYLTIVGLYLDIVGVIYLSVAVIEREAFERVSEIFGHSDRLNRRDHLLASASMSAGVLFHIAVIAASLEVWAVLAVILLVGIVFIEVRTRGVWWMVIADVAARYFLREEKDRTAGFKGITLLIYGFQLQVYGSAPWS